MDTKIDYKQNDTNFNPPLGDGGNFTPPFRG